MYSLQHLGFAGAENDFTNRHTAFMIDDLRHLAAVLRDAGGLPAYGNQRSEWVARCRPDQANPERVGRQVPARPGQP